MVALSENSILFIVIIVGGALLAFVMLSFYGGEGPDGFGYKLFRALWYDIMYFFGGPRTVEV